MEQPSRAFHPAAAFTQTFSRLTLTLFVLRILADYSDRSFSFNDLAFFADRFYRWSYFHWKSSFRNYRSSSDNTTLFVRLFSAFILHGSFRLNLQFRTHLYKEYARSDYIVALRSGNCKHFFNFFSQKICHETGTISCSRNKLATVIS